MIGGAVRRIAAEEGRRRLRAVRRELGRPWREGREGPAAETGRWIGLGLAVGAFVGGLAAAIYLERRRR